MKQQPYTIKLFMPDGNPSSFKIIEKMNWTGIGLEISRGSWIQNKNRPEFDNAGIYILVGYEGSNDLPTLYIGQGDGVKRRIDDHMNNKEFWDRAIVFVSSNGGLNRAHITWLEWSLIMKAKEANRCILDNNTEPKEPILIESEKADTKKFLDEILSILPLIEVKIFEKATIIHPYSEGNVTNHEKLKFVKDTVIVPAQEDGFNKVFIGENCWYAIRIGGGMLNKIKYIASYQTAPISAITHYAEVDTIELYGEGNKYKLNFKNSAIKLNVPIRLGNAKKGAMQGITYTSFEKLQKAREVSDL